MQNLLELPEFHYGYPDSDQDWFGLWSPVLDCFVLVGDDWRMLEQVQALTLSKLVTVVVKLDRKLAQTNAIDNLCSTNWTLKHFDQINFSAVFNSNKVFSTALIELCPSRVNNSAQILQVQSWFVFVWHWVKVVDQTLTDTLVETSAMIFGADAVSSKKRSIYETLLLEQDIDICRRKITQILDQ